MGEEHRIVVPGVMERIPDICDFVVAAARRAGLNERAVYHCQMAVDEACTNIVEHGYSVQEENGDIEVTCCDERGSYAINIQDNSPPFNPLTQEDPDPRAPLSAREPGGWGIYFIKRMMDGASYAYEDGHNKLTMIKAKTPQNLTHLTGIEGQMEATVKALEDEIWQISPIGRMDSNTAPDFAVLLDAQLNAEHRRLIVDMSGISYISTSGLKVLVNAWRRAREEAGGNVVLVGLNSYIFEVFETVGFDQVFDIFDTVSEALQKFSDHAT
jgi:anti-anti-sigma factor